MHVQNEVDIYENHVTFECCWFFVHHIPKKTSMSAILKCQWYRNIYQVDFFLFNSSIWGILFAINRWYTFSIVWNPKKKTDKKTFRLNHTVAMCFLIVINTRANKSKSKSIDFMFFCCSE